MNYFAYVKKPSPIHSLWRKQNLYRANLQGTLFTFNKRLQRYEASGMTGDALELLVRNPHVHIELTTEAISEVVVDSSVPPVSGDPIQDVEEKTSEEATPAITPVEPEGSASIES